MSNSMQAVSSINQITSNVQFDNRDFSFVDTYGSMINNREYRTGYDQFYNKKNTKDAFLYTCISAIGNDVENTLYLNIRKYIDFVSNVDICKIKSLRSMLYIFGFKYSIFDNLNDIPLEIVQLMDVLSINKKYIMKDNVLKKEFIDVLSSIDNGVIFNIDDINLKLDFKKYFTLNAYQLSTEENVVNSSKVNVIKLNDKFNQTSTLSVKNDIISNCISNDLSVYIKNEIDDFISGGLSDYLSYDLTSYLSSQLSDMISSRFQNSYDYTIIDDKFNKKFNIYNDNKDIIFDLDEEQIENYLRLQNDCIGYDISNLNRYENVSNDNEFIELNESKKFELHFSNKDHVQTMKCIDDVQFFNYIKSLYYNLIYKFLTMTYNAQFVENSRLNEVYIYPYLGSMYYNDDIVNEINNYTNLDNTTNDILEIKLFNHVPKSFNEKTIVDNIEEGLDDIDSYSGAQLSILNLELQRRAASLDLSKIGVSNNSSKNLQTRYSYYREKNVAKYAKFVDNYYNTIFKKPEIYDFDFNYYVINKTDDQISNVIVINDRSDINPDNDISKDMIDTVAEYLASLTVYINKIREKIKLQTQKNYMKGTNLLLIYIINEYLIDYSRNNKKFFFEDADKCPEILSIYNALSNHQFGDEYGSYNINIHEYYDQTEYFNISTETTISSYINKNKVNTRYWENDIAVDTEDGISYQPVMKSDGKAFSLAEIEKFYLSAFNLKNDLYDMLENESDGMQNFLSSLYDLGANNSFYYGNDKYDSLSSIFQDVTIDIDEIVQLFNDMGISNDFVNGIYDGTNENSLSIFSSVIGKKDDGNYLYASDIYDRYMKTFIAYDIFKSYIDKQTYTFPPLTIKRQLQDVRNTHISSRLDEYYLQNLSIIYDTYNPVNQQISSDMIDLSSDYVKHVNEDYSMYYKKSLNKYCYEDYDVTEKYLPNYYVGNSQYVTDDMLLYQKLEGLRTYSTEENIQNNPLIYTINYISSNLDNIWYGCSAYKGILSINKELTTKYKFIEPNFDTLDEEINYTYEFLNNLVTDRKTVLYNQLAALQTQANNLKTQYDSLNNTFTQAIANFNDNNDGYTLGDDSIRAVSYNEIPKTDTGDFIPKTEDNTCFLTKDGRPTSDIQWVIKHSVAESDVTKDRWYYQKFEPEIANYGLSVIDITPYDPESILEDKCNQVLEYINTVTMFNINKEGKITSLQRTLQNEGIKAVCDNTLQGLKDIESSYDNICSQAEELFGIDIDFPSVDIYGKINDLIKALTAVDEEQINNDSILSNYRSYLTLVMDLSAKYTPVATAFKDIFQDPEQKEFFKDFTYQMTDLTYNNVNILIDYRKTKDAENFKLITDIIADFIDVRFQDLITRKNKLISDINQAINDDDSINQQIALLLYTGNTQIEIDLVTIYNKLIEIIDLKYSIAKSKVNKHLTIVDNCIQIFTTELEDLLNVETYFEKEIELVIDDLNFFIKDIYNKYQKMYLTYGGNQFCYDSYYNLKNMTHPSYQIHPFLWNMVQKTKNDILIERGFKASEDLIDLNVKGMIGDFGQTIDTWKNNEFIDYSGYSTRYEKSSNISPSSGNLVNEVVDYDGAFYPPAAADFLFNSIPCISSVYDAKKKTSVLNDVQKHLSNEISTYISYNKIKRQVTNTIYNQISGVITSYFISNDIENGLNAYLNDSSTILSDITYLDINNIIKANTPASTFYERYYHHLNLPLTQLHFIGQQLIEYEGLIKDIISPKHEKEVYNIYKYGLDTFKNSYILYKRYDYKTNGLSINELTYKQKRNTLGEMWIRLSNHPIAFPAFYGEHPAYILDYGTKVNNNSYAQPLHTAILNLAKLQEDGITYKDKYKKHIKSINNKMVYFYDFEFTQNRQNISYITYNWKFPEDKFYTRFDFAIVVPNVVNTYYDNSEDLEYLIFNNSNDGNIDYIDFDTDSVITSYRSKYQFNDETLKEGIRYPALVGYYVYDFSLIDFVYVYKRYTKTLDEDGNVIYDIQISNSYPKSGKATLEKDKVKNFFIIRINNGNEYLATPSSGGKSIYDFQTKHKVTVNDNVCVGYDKNRSCTTLAFITQIDNQELSTIAKTETSISAVDFDLNTEGGIITDPVQIEMNSHDVFKQNVSLIEYIRKPYELDKLRYDEYNINADISYIPSYPRLSGEAKLYQRYNKYNYDRYNIELLGKSHDIDKYIKLINPDPDPYFDLEKISESTTFGRVYEDYVKDLEKSFMQYDNPTLNDNMPVYSSLSPYYTTKDDILKCYKLVFKLNNFNTTNPFNEHDIDNMMVIMYNKSNLGKNPYYLGKLIDLEQKIKLNYNDFNIDVDNENQVSSDITYGSSIKIVGTPNTKQIFSKKDSNHITGVTSIESVFIRSKRELEIIFYYDEKTFKFVPSNVLNTVFYNLHDLTTFKYYHMLDSYGAINCRYLDNIIDPKEKDIEFDGWGIYYSNEKVKKTDISTLLQSYYYEKGQKKYLSDIELSTYNELSDIYVLQGNKRLGFKYDEELRFDVSSDMYYYPTLNISYPRTYGDYIHLNKPFSVNAASAVAITSILEEDSLFLVDLDNPKTILDKIGDVDIPIIYNDVNDVRAFEDYLSVNADGINNYDLYDTEDPRAYQFIHFAVISDENEPGGINKNCTQINVPEKYYKNKTIDQFLEACKSNLSGCQPLKSEELTADIVSEYITVKPTSENSNIDNFLKLYVGYKRNRDDNDSIELYFNYMNYLNSPYIKIDNGTQTKIDTIDNTYLKLKKDEDGFLDIVLQIKYYVGEQICGYRNIKVLSYHIFNISDDKPKFLAYKSFELAENSQTFEDRKTEVNVNIIANDIDLDVLTSNKVLTGIEVPIYIDIASSRQLKANNVIEFTYPYSILSIDTSDTSFQNGYQIIASESSPGFLKIKITNQKLGSYRLSFKLINNYQTLLKYINRKFLLTVNGDMYDIDGKSCIMNFNPSSISVTKLNNSILADHNADNSIVDIIIADNIKNAIILD